MTEPVQLPVRQGYDAWSRVYDTEGNPLLALEEPVVRRWLRDVSGRLVADVGSGTGRHTRWLAAAGARVIALDLSEGMMARAVARAGGGRVLFCRHRLPDALPLDGDTCDHVLCALVGDHIQRLDEMFAEFRRVLAPGGSLVFTVLHPAMNLNGLTARFYDPDTGGEVRVAAFEHTFSDYVMAVVRGGLELDEIVERTADEETARRAPRARKYLGWPMLLAIRAVKRPGASPGTHSRRPEETPPTDNEPK